MGGHPGHPASEAAPVGGGAVGPGERSPAERGAASASSGRAESEAALPAASEAASLWGGRFAAPPDELFRRLNDSLPVDRRLVREDLRGSMAWARGIAAAGAITQADAAAIVAGLEAILAEVERDPSIVAGDDEDVHAWVEARLVERIGDAGRRLHTGRSRNDQVATDLRLWMKAAIDDRVEEIRGVQRALVALGVREEGVIVPGYTHLQRAQPVLFAHWCLAYVEMLERDAGRLDDAKARMDECPLGCGALAGTSWPVDRGAIAADLGFARPTRNSLDTVSARDHVLEALAALSILGLHLSRLAEDLVFMASGEAAFVECSDRTSTGSSLMPQKKNPDALELVRAKSGVLFGAFTGLAMVVKGLPLAYNKDLQEDKPALFRAMDEASLALRVVPIVLEGLVVARDRARAAAAGGYADATELADHLVARGVPFRTAHEQAGRCVRAAIERGCDLAGLSVEDLREHAPEVGDDVHEMLGPEVVVARKDVPGGTAPDRVAAALREAAERLGG